MTFRPMLAGEAELDKLRFPLYASPKLDGIRCAVVNGRALTRTLKPVPNDYVRTTLSRPELTGLDGELVVGSANAPDVYRATTSGIMSKEGTPAFFYHVFDMHNMSGTWEQRFRKLGVVAQHAPSVQMLHHRQLDSLDDLLAYETVCTQEGFEGLILRSPFAPYKFGRSTTREGYLLKLKRFHDSEAKVLDIIEEMHNANEAQTNELGRTKRSSHKENKIGKGRMGALRVCDIHTGVEFEVGTGFTDDDKHWWWAQRGSALPIIKYKFFPVGVKDKPRHPVYLGVRNPADIS